MSRNPRCGSDGILCENLAQRARRRGSTRVEKMQYLRDSPGPGSASRLALARLACRDDPRRRDARIRTQECAKRRSPHDSVMRASSTSLKGCAGSLRGLRGLGTAHAVERGAHASLIFHVHLLEMSELALRNFLRNAPHRFGDVAEQPALLSGVEQIEQLGDLLVVVIAVAVIVAIGVA